MITYLQEPCDNTNSYFVDRLTTLNSSGKGRQLPNTMPDVHGVIWANDDHTPAGALFYDLEKSQQGGGLWIVLVYVEPAYRQQGIYKSLHLEANKVAKAHGLTRVVTWFSLNNKKMFQIGKSVGYNGTMVIMERRLDES
jgi:GNAT superfamily N-acetyltransferase